VLTDRGVGLSFGDRGFDTVSTTFCLAFTASHRFKVRDRSAAMARRSEAMSDSPDRRGVRQPLEAELVANIAAVDDSLDVRYEPPRPRSS
jgi:hypothetical protein